MSADVVAALNGFHSLIDQQSILTDGDRETDHFTERLPVGRALYSAGRPTEGTDVVALAPMRAYSSREIPSGRLVDLGLLLDDAAGTLAAERLRMERTSAALMSVASEKDDRRVDRIT